MEAIRWVSQETRLRSKVVLGGELVLNHEGWLSREADLSWKQPLTKGLRLGREGSCLCVVHRLWWRPGGHRRVHVIWQDESNNWGHHRGGELSGVDGWRAGRGLDALVIPKACQRGVCVGADGSGSGVNLEGVARHHCGIRHGKGGLRGVGWRPGGRVKAVVQTRRPQMLLLLLPSVMRRRAVRGLDLLRSLRLGFLVPRASPRGGLCTWSALLEGSSSRCS